MSNVAERFKERNEKLSRDFLKILEIIESDYHIVVTDGEKRDPSELEWDIYRMILRNYVNVVVSAPKAHEMGRHIDALMKVEHEDFGSVTTELYTRFMSIVQK